MGKDNAEDKQLLTVSSPCLLLNHIAQRYTRTSRIILEYVDNSLDDAEALYDESKNAYSRPVNILVEIKRLQVQEPESIKSQEPNLETNSKPEIGNTVSTKEDSCKATQKKKKKSINAHDRWITEVTVTDNCRGMNKKTLNRLIVNVGESTKRGSKFTNGHFGFGVHAFRACAKRIEFKTRQNGGKTLGLKIDRENEFFSTPKYLPSEGVATNSGTVVKVSDFDDTWSEQLNPKELVKEIKHHFSGLLERDFLTIQVKDIVRDVTIVCKPLQYDNFKVSKSVEKEYKFGEDSVRLRLFVVRSAQPGKNCMFISKGRRVNEVSDVKSFMKMSRCRWAVWGHPNLVGLIDVTNVLEPVITRDEFRLNVTRKAVYRKIVEEVEPVLYKALHEVNENRKVLALAKLENVVAKCINTAVKKDLRRQEDGMSYLQQLMLARKASGRKKIDEDFDVENLDKSKKRKRLEDDLEVGNDDSAHPAGGQKDPAKEEQENPKKKRKTGLGLRIAFVKDLPSERTGEPCRSRLVGEDVQINMKHPDFLNRIKINKSNHQPVVTERLCGYLANVVSAAYKSHAMLCGGGMEKYADNHSTLLNEILDLTLSMETQLRSKLKLMQREMESGAEAAAANKNENVNLPTGEVSATQ